MKRILAKMSNLVKNKGALIITIFIILLICCIFFTAVSFAVKTYLIGNERNFFKYEEQVDHPSEATFWLSYTGIMFSFFSIVTVVITLALQLRELNLQKKSLVDNYKISEDNYDAYVLQLIEKFLGPEIAESRKICWFLRAELKTNKSKLYDIEKLFMMQIRDEWGTRQEYENLQQTKAFQDYAHFTKLIRFFDMLSHYNITKQTAYAIHFYYVWWRGFFVDMIECYKSAEQTVPHNEHYMTVSPSWYDLIERMDVQMAKHNLAVT